jgi:hypothetical protein
MPWTNAPLTLYHGTVGPHARNIQANGTALTSCTPNTDFGRGFYTTRIFDDAAAHARSRFSDLQDFYIRMTAHIFQVALDPEYPAVIEFLVRRETLGRLGTLGFVQPTPDWLEFVKHCRVGGVHRMPQQGAGNLYDVVYGPMYADDGTDSAIPGREQISFHTDSAVGVLVRTGNIHRLSP